MAEDATHEGPQLTLVEHLDELRRRLIYALLGLAIAMIAALVFGNHLVDAFRHPYVQAMEELGREPQLTVLSLSKAFTTYIKIALVAGLVVSSPWVFYQLWQFIASGLYRPERRFVTYTAPASALLFVAGVLFLLLVVAIPIIKFFVNFSSWLGLTSMVTFDSYVSFVTGLALVFGLAFQTPLVVLMLGRLGLVTLATLRYYRRHVIVVILILAATFTPPDIISQLSLALPVWLLYEIGVILVWLFAPAAKEDS